MPRESECRTCQWWSKHEGGTKGDCRKKSPGVVEEDNLERYFIGTAIWPGTDPNDFCGSYSVDGAKIADMVLHPDALPEGVADAVAKVNKETEMDLALKAFDEE